MRNLSFRPYLIFLAALLFRLGIFFAGSLPGYVNDSFYYVPVAKEIAAGHGFQFVWPWASLEANPDQLKAAREGNPGLKITQDGVVSKMLLADPGYALFLAFLYMIGITGNSGVMLVQCILSALLAPALYTYVLRRNSPTHATAAGLLYALDPLAASTCFFLLREIFVMMVIAIAVFALDLTHRYATAVKGFLLGVATLSFSLLGLWSIFLWIWDRWLSPKRRAVTAGVVLCAWMVFGLWAVRNILISDGNYAFRRTQTGILLYYVSHYDFPYLPNPARPDFKKVLDEAGQRFGDGFTVEQRKLEKEILKAVWETFKAAPFTVTWRFVKANFWFWVEVPGAMGMLESRPAVHAAFLIFHLAQLFCFLAGLFFMFKSGDASSYRFVWGTVAYLAIFVFPFMPIPRYYAPFLPLIDICAAYGAVRLCR